MESEEQFELCFEVFLKANKEAVWELLTSPSKMTTWFCDEIIGKFQVGETVILDFGRGGICYVVIEEIVMNSRVVLKWYSEDYGDSENNLWSHPTIVEFNLKSQNGGSCLSVRETGFDQYPDRWRSGLMEFFARGWEYELKQLQKFVHNDCRQVDSTDELERVREFPVSVEKLWSLFTTEDGLCTWYGASLDGEFAEGEILRVQLGGGDFNEIRFKKLDPMLSASWETAPAYNQPIKTCDEGECILLDVKVTFTEIEGGTSVRILMTGFNRLPSELKTDFRISNSREINEALNVLTDLLSCSKNVVG